MPPFKLNKSKCRISIRGPALGKYIPTDAEKKHQKTMIFKILMTNQLLTPQNELTYLLV